MPPTPRQPRPGLVNFHVAGRSSIDFGGAASRQGSMERSARSEPLGLCWNGTDEGGLESNLPALLIANSHASSPLRLHGNPRDACLNGGLPPYIERGRKKGTDNKVWDHFVNAGEVVDQRHERGGEQIERDYVRRGSPYGKRHFGDAPNADHFLDMDVAAGDVGLHGNSRSDVLEGGLPRYVGAAKRHVPRLDHFRNCGETESEPQVPALIQQLSAEAELGAPAVVRHQAGARCSSTARTPSRDAREQHGEQAANLRWPWPAPLLEAVGASRRADTSRSGSPALRQIEVCKEYVRAATSKPSPTSGSGTPGSCPAGLDSASPSPGAGHTLRRPNRTLAPSDLWMRWPPSAGAKPESLPQSPSRASDRSAACLTAGLGNKERPRYIGFRYEGARAGAGAAARDGCVEWWA